MSQGPPLGPLVVVAVPVHALVVTGAPPVPEDTAPSEVSAVILQPRTEAPRTASSESSFQKFFVLIGITRIVRNDDSCYRKFLGTARPHAKTPLTCDGPPAQTPPSKSRMNQGPAPAPLSQ